MSSRLLVALPLYLHLPVAWFLRWVAMDHTHVAGIEATRKLYLGASMNRLVEDALKVDDWDRLVIYEADMMPPVFGFNRIAAYPDKLDIVGSIYFQHDAPHHPICYWQADEDHFAPVSRGKVDNMMAKPGLYPMDAVGMGFTSIHRRVLENWDPDIPMWGNDVGLGHDMWFCREARRQGYKVYVDSGIECSHLTEVGINYENTKQ